MSIMNFSQKLIKTRFAPSPTGYVHIGSIRTALINFIYSRLNNGKFIVRIENTDESRCASKFFFDIKNSLEYFSIKPDAAPWLNSNYSLIQSNRKRTYKRFAQDLLDRGVLYKCFCSSNRLSLLKKLNPESYQGYDNKCRSLSRSQAEELSSQNLPFVLRFRNSDKKIEFEDGNFGIQSFHQKTSDSDPIMVKSSSMPVYHFANIVDDYTSGISHVFRGMEWLTSTPLHISLYNEFGWPIPKFTHLSLLLEDSGKKLSKRSPMFEEYGQVHRLCKDGHSPLALTKWILSLGSPDVFRDNLFKCRNMDEIISIFSTEIFSTNNVHMNLAVYKDLASNEQLISFQQDSIFYTKNVRQFLNSQIPNGIDHLSDEELSNILRVIVGRIFRFSDLLSSDLGLKYLWIDPETSDSPYQISINQDNFSGLIKLFLAQPTRDGLVKVKNECSRKSIVWSSFMKDLRFVLTGSPVGLPIADLIEIIPENMILKRINKFID